MTDSIGSRNIDESNVIDSVAFGLATLERHGDQAREIDRLVQQVSLARKQFDGVMAELLWATENFLAAINSGTLNDVQGSHIVLQDLSQYLHRASSKTDTTIFDNEELDELLERLDFLASGGTDREVPKKAATSKTPPREFIRISFPMEPSTNIEDPLLTSILEHDRSTSQLLVSSLSEPGDSHSRELLRQHVQLLDSIDTRIREQSCVGPAELAEQLAKSVRSNSKKQSEISEIEIRQSSSSNRDVYKSLANFLASVIQDLLQVLSTTTANRPQATIEFHTEDRLDELAFTFRLKGIKSKLADRLDSTIRSLAAEGSSRKETQESGSEKDSTSSTVIQHALSTFARAVQSIAGSLVFKNHESGTIEIEATVNKRTRLTKVVPVTIDSNRYGIEAYLIQAAIPANSANCDIYRNLVVHEGNSYEYRTLGLARKLDQIGSNDLGFLILVDCNSQKLALHADEIHEIETVALRVSSSDLEFGNAMSLPPSSLLQLDLNSDSSGENYKPSSKSREAQAHTLYLCDIPATLGEKFNAATKHLGIECEVVQGFFETIRALQERRPRILVLQDTDKGSNWLDLLRLARNYTNLSSVQVLITTTNDESRRSRFAPEFPELKWISEDVQGPELVELLTRIRGTEELEKSLLLD